MYDSVLLFSAPTAAAAPHHSFCRPPPEHRRRGAGTQEEGAAARAEDLAREERPLRVRRGFLPMLQVQYTM